MLRILFFCACALSILDCAQPGVNRNQNNLYYNPYDTCLDTETGKKIYIGDFINRSDRCSRIQCSRDLRLLEIRCHVPKLGANCSQMPTDNGIPFPHCCPLYECLTVLDNGDFKERTVYDQYGNMLSNSYTRVIHVTTRSKNQLDY